MYIHHLLPLSVRVIACAIACIYTCECTVIHIEICVCIYIIFQVPRNICLCLWVCMHQHVYIHSNAHLYIWKYACIYTLSSKFLKKKFFGYECACNSMYIYVYVCLYVLKYVQVYIISYKFLEIFFLGLERTFDSSQLVVKADSLFLQSLYNLCEYNTYMYMCVCVYVVFVCQFVNICMYACPPDPINHLCSLTGEQISQQHFTYRSVQILKILFQIFYSPESDPPHKIMR